MTAAFRVEVLGDHDRTSFGCGEEALDRYLETLVTQDVRRHITTCFVAVEATTGVVAGFYTIAATSIAMSDLPAELTKRLPRYPTLPGVRIGRLAVDQRFAGRGLGGALLVDAAKRALRSEVAAHAVVVDAKNEQAVMFYEHHGFQRFESRPETLLLPLTTAAKALARGA